MIRKYSWKRDAPHYGFSDWFGDTELARELHVPANRVSQLVAGKRAVTADTALRLERWLGVSAEFWMNLQKRYELDIAREGSDDVLRMIEPLHRISPKLKTQPL